MATAKEWDVFMWNVFIDKYKEIAEDYALFRNLPGFCGRRGDNLWHFNFEMP